MNCPKCKQVVNPSDSFCSHCNCNLRSSGSYFKSAGSLPNPFDTPAPKKTSEIKPSSPKPTKPIAEKASAPTIKPIGTPAGATKKPTLVEKPSTMHTFEKPAKKETAKEKPIEKSVATAKKAAGAPLNSKILISILAAIVAVVGIFFVVSNLSDNSESQESAQTNQNQVVQNNNSSSQAQNNNSANASQNQNSISQNNAAIPEVTDGMRLAEKLAIMWREADYNEYAKYTAYDYHKRELSCYQNLSDEVNNNSSIWEYISSLKEADIQNETQLADQEHIDQLAYLKKNLGNVYAINSYAYQPIVCTGNSVKHILNRILKESEDYGLTVRDFMTGFDQIDKITVYKIELIFVGDSMGKYTSYMYMLDSGKLLWASDSVKAIKEDVPLNFVYPARIRGNFNFEDMIVMDTAVELARTYLAEHPEIMQGGSGWGTMLVNPIKINGQYYYKIYYTRPDADTREDGVQYYLHIYTGEIYKMSEIS